MDQVFYCGFRTEVLLVQVGFGLTLFERLRLVCMLLLFYVLLRTWKESWFHSTSDPNQLRRVSMRAMKATKAIRFAAMLLTRWIAVEAPPVAASRALLSFLKRKTCYISLLLYSGQYFRVVIVGKRTTW